MCLLTNQIKPKIADRDIIVYKKLIRLYSCDYGITKLVSLFKSHFEWIIGKTYKTRMTVYPHKKSPDKQYFDILVQDAYLNVVEQKDRYHPNCKHLVKVPKCSRTRCVVEGFHAFTTLDRGGRYKDDLYIAIIPKGSKYYTDKTGLIVSDQMKILKQYKNP